MIKELNIEEKGLNQNAFIDLEKLKKEIENNPFGKVLLYVKDNRIVAYLYYSEIYERVEINKIEVESRYQNQKIGTKLLDFLTKTVDKTISLEVRKNNYNAIKLYKKFNFQEKALRKGYYQGIDGILMVRE